MLWKKLRKNIDWLLFIIFFMVVYLGGWQAQVFGFLQRGILATGIFNAQSDGSYEKSVETDLNFNLSDINNEILSVQDFKGKTIFINFWASWCPPCRAEMPSIQSLYSDLKNDDDIIFLIVSEDDEQEKAKEYINKNAFTFPVYFISSQISGDLSHQSIPCTSVISPEGKLVYHHEGMANYDTDDFKRFLKRLN